MPIANVSFERKVFAVDQTINKFPTPKAESWSKSVVPICPFEACSSGLIEDQMMALEVDFANKYLGGGALNKGCVQAIFYGYPETGSDDDGLDLSVDDFFLSGSSSDEAEPKCKVWHNPGALLENIIYPRAYTYEHQYNMLLDLASKMNEEPFRLLIVDYVITLLCVRLVLTSLEEDNLQSARASGAPECVCSLT
ncbi:poly(ADP-ribose) glycohydrolase 1-like protein isoform X1 [Tanacetum coccineum]